MLLLAKEARSSCSGLFHGMVRHFDRSDHSQVLTPYVKHKAACCRHVTRRALSTTVPVGFCVVVRMRSLLLLLATSLSIQIGPWWGFQVALLFDAATGYGPQAETR